MKKYVKRVVNAILNRPNAVYKAEKNYVIKTNEDKELSGCVALVTGANGTIGRAICHMLHANGAKVYLGGRNKEKINLLLSEFKGENAGVSIFEITKEDSVRKAIEDIVNQEGKIDIVVNCAGGSARDNMNNLINQSFDIIDNVVSSNLRGTMLCSKYSAKYMVANKKGCIINIASTTGIQGNEGNCDYAAAKSAVIGFTKALAQELGRYSVRVNCVSPGFIQTGSFDDERVAHLVKTNFLHQVGEPEDIANAVVFLCSDKAKFITGINMVVDGGRILGLHTLNQ